MKNLKFLFVAVILTCYVGVTQTKAQVYIERGTESDAYEPLGPKPVVFEIDGVQYFAWVETEYQLVLTPSLNVNWTSHGQIVEVHKDDQYGEIVEGLKFQKAVNIYDPRGYPDKITITANGKVNVTAHIKNHSF
jgi:hypothetical protein